MSNLEKKSSQLPKELNDRVIATIQEENAKMLDRISALDERLTNGNFLANGAGAIAVLSYYSSNSNTPALNWALLCFCVGVIATGIERRAILNYFGYVSRDNARRNSEYWDDNISLREFSEIPVKVGQTAKIVNHIAGWLSQLMFIVGVVLGAVTFLC